MKEAVNLSAEAPTFQSGLRMPSGARRKAAGLTQTVVAERLGKPPSYVAKYEGGDRRLDVLEFLDVAAAIGFEPSALIRSLLRK